MSPDRSRPDALAVVDVDPPPELRLGAAPRRPAQQGRRVPPFRLERLLVGTVAAHRPRVPGAALPDHPGASAPRAFISWIRSPIPPRRRSSRSSSPRRSCNKTGYSRPPHGPLRSGRHLRQHARRRRQGWHRWAAWRLHHGLRDVRHPRPLGDRPRTPDKHYDFWWNLPRDYMVTSEWGLPPQFENGIVPEDLLANKYGHQIHFWDLRGPAQRPDDRSRRQPPDGAGGAARA